MSEFIDMEAATDRSAAADASRTTDQPSGDDRPKKTVGRNKKNEGLPSIEAGVHRIAPPVVDYRNIVASIEQCQERVYNSRALQNDIREIRRIIKNYIGRMQEKDSHAKVTKEWRIVARVFDRLFFLMYVSTIIVSLATIFPKG